MVTIVDSMLAAEFEAHMRAQYPRAIESHGIAFVAEYAEEFTDWLKTRNPPTFDEFEEHLREMAVIKTTHPHLSHIGDALLEAADRLAHAREDVARFEWVLPIITADDGPVTNARTFALGKALAKGLEGREAIDAARKDLE